jgi:hypothetical protein
VVGPKTCIDRCVEGKEKRTMRESEGQIEDSS